MNKKLTEKVDKLEATLARAFDCTRELANAITKANESAVHLIRCASSISNPTYSVAMHGRTGELKILAVRHFQGQICITVENPLTDVGADPRRLRGPLREADPTLVQIIDDANKG